MRLHQATRYAIWVCVHLASRPGEQVSAAQLAELFGISQHHLAKVIRSLSFARLVTSTRGPGGGCLFIGDAKRVTLYDIIALFEDQWWIDSEMQANPPAVDTLREVARVLTEIDRITMATLRSITIQTIINNAERERKRSEAAAAEAGEDAAAKEGLGETGTEAGTEAGTNPGTEKRAAGE